MLSIVLALVCLTCGRRGRRVEPHTWKLRVDPFGKSQEQSRKTHPIGSDLRAATEGNEAASADNLFGTLKILTCLLSQLNSAAALNGPITTAALNYRSRRTCFTNAMSRRADLGFVDVHMRSPLVWRTSTMQMHEQKDVHRQIAGSPLALVSKNGTAIGEHQQLAEQPAVSTKENSSSIQNLTHADVNVLRRELENAESRFGTSHTHTLAILNALAHRQEMLVEMGLNGHGPEHEEVLGNKSDLAATLQSLGNLERAESLQREVMEARRRKLGSDDPAMVSIKMELAKTLYARGKLDAAEAHQREVLESMNRTLGPDNPDTLASQTALASILRGRGAWDAAKALQRAVLGVRNRTLGPEHPDTLRSESDLAITFRAQGDLKAAEALQQQIFEVRNRTLGAGHPDTLAIVNDIVITLKSCGDLKEVELLQQDVLTTLNRTLGPEDPLTLRFKSNLSLTLDAQGDLESAEVLQRQIYDVARRTYGSKHPVTLMSMNTLTVTLQRRRKLRGATALKKLVWKARVQTLGSEHPDTLRTKNDLAILLQDLGNLEGAETMQREVFEARRRTLGPKHPDTLTSKNDLARTLISRGDLEAAEILQREVLEARGETLGPRHPDTLSSKNNLASILQERRDLGGAEKLQREVLELRSRELGLEHPDTLRTKSDLANTMFFMRSLRSAESLQREVLEARNRTLGSEHPDTVRTKNDLARTLQNCENLGGAETLMQEVSEAKSRNPDVLSSQNTLAGTLQDRRDLEGSEMFEQEELPRNVTLGPLSAIARLRDSLFGSLFGSLSNFWNGVQAKRKRLIESIVGRVNRLKGIVFRDTREIESQEAGIPLGKRYFCSDWLEILKDTPRSVVLRRIKEPVLSNIVFAAAMASALPYFDCEINYRALIDPLRFSSGALVLLLVFRTNSAYQRFWEGRNIWQDVIDNARTFAGQILTLRNDVTMPKAKLKRLANLVCVFSSVLARNLGASTNEDYSQLITPEELTQINQEGNRPLRVLNMLREEIRSIPDASEQKALSTYVEKMSNAIGACEKLVDTPVPLSYVRHTSRFLSTFCFTMSIVLAGEIGWAIVPVIGLFSWALFAIQEIGLMIEQPFKGELPLDRYVRRIYADVQETVNTPERQDKTKKLSMDRKDLTASPVVNSTADVNSLDKPLKVGGPEAV